MHASSSAITAGKYSHDFRMKRIEFWWNPLLLVLTYVSDRLDRPPPRQGPFIKNHRLFVVRFHRYPELSRDVPYSVSRMAAFGYGR